MTMRPLLDAPALAHLLGISTTRFLRRRPQLEMEHGFPPPVRGLALRWDPLAIEAWLAAQRQGAVSVTVAPAHDWEAILAARAQALPARAD